MALGLIGKKLGMAQFFDAQGTVVPVTVIQAGPCYVAQIKSTTAADRYNALQLGYDEVRRERLTRPQRGHLRRAMEAGKCGPLRTLREFRVDDVSGFQVGQKIDASAFQVGDLVDITGTSIGKGFQGIQARHHHGRGSMTHGSKFHRHPGSINAGTTPGRVFKGRKMAGRQGGRRVTVRFLEVVRVDPERNVLAVKGAVPGVERGLLLIQPSFRVGSKAPAKAKKKPAVGSKQ